MHGLEQVFNTLVLLAIIGLISLLGCGIFCVYKLVTWIF
jgi:hypothetical protein